MGKVTYRSFCAGDEAGIVDLFLQGGPHTRTVGFWRWFNQENPFGESIVEIAEIDGRIIGHYAVRPLDLDSGPDRVRAGFAAQAMIHTRHRNLEHILAITERVWERCVDDGLSFVYGFPNDNTWQLNRMLMGWEHISDIPTWERPIEGLTIAAEPARSGVTVSPVDLFDDRVNHVWRHSSMARSRNLAVIRNAQFLNWRFCHHPIHHYQMFRAELDREVVGYIVLKLYRKAGVSYGHVVDLATVDTDHTGVTLALLERVLEFFQWAAVDTISFWLQPENPSMEVFLALGFRPSGFSTHLGCKRIGGDVLLSDLSRERWHLTMADSDAF